MTEDDQKLDQVVAQTKAIDAKAEKIDLSTEDLRPYIEHFTDRFDAQSKALEALATSQLETSKFITVLFQRSNEAQSIAQSSGQAIADVSAIRQQLEQSNEAVHTSIPGINQKVEKNAVKIDLLNAKNVGWLRGILGITIGGFVLNILWQTLPLVDRQEIARKAIAPLVSVAGLGSIAAYFFNQSGEGSENDDSTP